MRTNNIQKKDLLQVKTSLHLEMLVRSLTKSQRLVLNELIGMSGKYKNLYMAQGTIGKNLGCTRRTVNSAMRRLSDLGLIAKKYRYMETSLYWVAPWFKEESIRKLLVKLLPALWFMPIVYLTVFAIPSFAAANFSPLNSRYKEFINGNNTSAVQTGWVLAKQVVLQEDKKRAERIMRQSNPIRPEILRVAKKYGFTTAGMIKLMAFGDTAIKEIDEKHWRKIYQARDPFAYMLKLILDWYKSNPQNVPNWYTVYKLQERFGITDEAPRFIKNYHQKKKDSSVPLSEKRVSSLPVPQKLPQKGSDGGLSSYTHSHAQATRTVGSQKVRSMHGGNPINPHMRKMDYRPVERKSTRVPSQASQNMFAQYRDNIPTYIKENDTLETEGQI